MSEMQSIFRIESLLVTQNKSTQIIYSILQEKPMKIIDIRQKTNYCERTIRISLQTLLDLQLIQKYPDLYDIRSSYYQVI